MEVPCSYDLDGECISENCWNKDFKCGLRRLKMTNKADERLGKLISGLEFCSNELTHPLSKGYIKESIRILESLKSENRGNWTNLWREDVMEQLDKLILNEME